VESCDKEETLILWWMHVWGAPKELQKLLQQMVLGVMNLYMSVLVIR
jgi:hypothetical protein